MLVCGLDIVEEMSDVEISRVTNESFRPSVIVLLKLQSLIFIFLMKGPGQNHSYPPLIY